LSVINEVTKDSVIILGFSDGAYTGYMVASMYPARVKKLVAIAGNGRRTGYERATGNHHCRAPNDPKQSAQYYSQCATSRIFGKFSGSVDGYSSFFKKCMMKSILLSFISCLIILTSNLQAQSIHFDKSNIELVNVYASVEKQMDKEVIKVAKDSTVKEADEPTYVKIKGINFKNGTIEVKVLSRLLKNAPEFARGFIGVAFRINDSNTKFECIYIRPTNGRVEDQVRRNHSIQYYSFPDYKFDRLRKESPEKYESYADMGLNEWIRLRIVVLNSQAKLFINDNVQPSLIVNDLKLGPDSKGAVGLWVETGTEGYFSELKIHRADASDL